MKNMKKHAQSLIEYGLILALVAVVAVTILGRFSNSINNVGTHSNDAINAAGNNSVSNYCTSIGQTYSAATGGCVAN